MNFVDAQNNIVELPKGETIYKRTSVYAIVFLTEKLLLYMPSYNSKWQLPGGGLEESSGEDLKGALIRECLEETGYIVKITDKKPFFKRKQNFYHRSTKKFFRSEQIFFRAELAPKKQIPKEVSIADMEGKVAWLSFDQLNEENIHPTLIQLIDLLRNHV